MLKKQQEVEKKPTVILALEGTGTPAEIFLINSLYGLIGKTWVKVCLDPDDAADFFDINLSKPNHISVVICVMQRSVRDIIPYYSIIPDWVFKVVAFDPNSDVQPEELSEFGFHDTLRLDRVDENRFLADFGDVLKHSLVAMRRLDTDCVA